LEILVLAAAASFASRCVLEILAFAAAAFFLATLGFFTPPINGGAWLARSFGHGSSGGCFGGRH
jgi:hypothetical protein